MTEGGKPVWRGDEPPKEPRRGVVADTPGSAAHSQTLRNWVSPDNKGMDNGGRGSGTKRRQTAPMGVYGAFGGFGSGGSTSRVVQPPRRPLVDSNQRWSAARQTTFNRRGPAVNQPATRSVFQPMRQHHDAYRAAGGAVRSSYFPRQPPPPPTGGAGGIANLGNTCFMNAAMQMLLPLEQMWDGTVAPRGALHSALVAMFEGRKRAGGDAEAAARAIMAAVKHVPNGAVFANGTQHDAQEFLYFLVDALEEEWVHAAVAAGERTEGDAEPLTPLQRLLRIDLTVRLECQSCDSVSDPRAEWLWGLSLPLPEPKHTTDGGETDYGAEEPSMRELLAAYLDVELVERTCEECGGKWAVAVRQLARLPPHLFLYIKRYQANPRTGAVEKLETSVALDPVLDVAPFSTVDTERSSPPRRQLPATAPQQQRPAGASRVAPPLSAPPKLRAEVDKTRRRYVSGLYPVSRE